MTVPTASPRPLRPANLLAYGVGEATVTISMVLFGLFVMFFYTSVMGLPATLVGIAAAAGLAWDAVIDPYIGHHSDHYRGRFGRRHGHMLVGAILSGLTFLLLLSPPRGLGVPALFGWILGSTLLFRTSGAVFRIPYLSLGAELSSDYHQRTAVVGVRTFFGLCGTLAAAALSFVLFFPERLPGHDPKLDYAGYPRLGLAFGVVMIVAGLVSTLGTTAPRRRPAVPPAGERPFLQGLASAWRSRAFRSVWLGFTLFFAAVVLNAAVAIHYFTWYVKIADSVVLSRLQLVFYGGALLGTVPWVRVARRVEKRTLCLVAVTALAVLMALATVLFGEGRLFGIGNAPPLVLGTGLAGFFAAALWVLPGSMLADVADLDELRTRHRREGLFFGLLNFGEKIGAGAALLAAGVLLDVVVGLEPGVAPSPEVAGRIGLLYGVLPACILVGAAVSLSRYTLDPRAVLAIQHELRRQGTSAPTGDELPSTAEVLGG
jgi:GPH family glycoside/pentoside/hexuronide:cation symporter